VLSLLARWRERLLGAGLAALGLVALTVYYGSPIPQSVMTKASIYGTPGPWEGRMWWDWLSPLALGRPPITNEGIHLFLMSVLFTPAVVMGVVTLWPLRRTAPAAVAAACLVVWLGYALLGVAYFWWYLVVPLGGFGVLAAAGMPRVVRGRAAYVSLALLIAGVWLLAPSLYVGRAQNEYYGFQPVGDFLATHGRPGQTVMLEPIGMVGYTAPMVVVDEVGLVSPEVTQRRLQGPGWYTDIAERKHPDWIVVRRGFLTGDAPFAGRGAPFRDLEERNRLFAGYELAGVADTVSKDRSLVILKRRE
jgi:hypothetical protein